MVTVIILILIANTGLLLLVSTFCMLKYLDDNGHEVNHFGFNISMLSYLSLYKNDTKDKSGSTGVYYYLFYISLFSLVLWIILLLSGL